MIAGKEPIFVDEQDYDLVSRFKWSIKAEKQIA